MEMVDSIQTVALVVSFSFATWQAIELREQIKASVETSPGDKLAKVNHFIFDNADTYLKLDLPCNQVARIHLG